MDPRDEIDRQELEPLTTAYREQLIACLEECARGRDGLFASDVTEESADAARAWPEAALLRELAVALQTILAQSGEQSALVDEFLDLCTIHGESDPGERKLARAFLERIERGEVGTNRDEVERRPW